MRLVEKSVWYIESHLNTAMSLDDIAKSAGVSKFALERGFRSITGHTVLAYARARRLSEAAKALCENTSCIMDIALSSGYGSHEAFSRAFRHHFGVTPDRVRRGHRALKLTEVIDMSNGAARPGLAPRFDDCRPLKIAGLSRRFSMQDTTGIPGLWQSFGEHIGSVPGEVRGVAYGVNYNSGGGSFDYLCGVEVSASSELLRGFTALEMPSGRYAIFHHDGHVTDIHALMRAIFSEWVPASGHQVAPAPILERYGPEFDSHTGAGGFDICVPIIPRRDRHG